jgi:hypothetical protein
MSDNIHSPETETRPAISPKARLLRKQRTRQDSERNVQIWEFAVFAEIIPRIFPEVYLLVKGRTYPSRQHLTCNLQYTYPLPCLFQ